MDAIWLLAILAYPLVMGAMMLFMKRGVRGHGGRSGHLPDESTTGRDSGAQRPR